MSAQPTSARAEEIVLLAAALMAVIVVWSQAGSVASAGESRSQGDEPPTSVGTRRALDRLRLARRRRAPQAFRGDRREAAQGADRSLRIRCLRGPGAVRREERARRRPRSGGCARAVRPRGNRGRRGRDAEAARPGGHALGDRSGARALRRAAFPPEHPRPGSGRAGIRQALSTASSRASRSFSSRRPRAASFSSLSPRLAESSSRQPRPTRRSTRHCSRTLWPRRSPILRKGSTATRTARSLFSSSTWPS